MNAEKLLSRAHLTMLLALLATLAAAAVAYGFEERFSMGAQLTAHLMLILMPAAIKLGYVVRLTALKQLGRPVN